MRAPTPFVAAALAGAASACTALEPPPPPPQEVVVRVSSDPGRAVQGAVLLYQGQRVAVTDGEGVGRLMLRGRDGESFDVNVQCPEGFRSPVKPISIILKRLADPSKRPEYAVACPPTSRKVVVAVRADGGPNLPVMYLGREIARTDESGAAHVLLTLKPDEHFELKLDTSEKGNERMRPKNPFASFTVKDQDDMFVFDQKFELERLKPVVRRGRPKPIRIQ